MKIWKDAYNSEVVLEKLTDEDINLAEKTFNVKLPKEYVEILFEQNGGYLLKDTIKFDFDIGTSNLIQVDSIFGIKKDMGIMKTDYLLNEWGVKNKGYIVIAGDGHYFIVLDYGERDKSPKISYIDTETGNLYIMFPSFKSFLENLEIPQGKVDEFTNNNVSNFLKKPSLESAKLLIETQDEDSIYTGIEYWDQSGEEPETFNNILLKLVCKTKFLSIQELTAEILWRKIMTDEINNKERIQKVIESIPDSPLKLVQDYKKQIIKHYNEIE